MLANLICRVLDRESSWWGVSRFKPAPVQPYTSGTLLLVCLIQGVPLAAVVYLAWYGACAWGKISLTDEREWLPRSMAWGFFVLNLLIQAVGCWAWNRRCFRLAPEAFRYRHQRA